MAEFDTCMSGVVLVPVELGFVTDVSFILKPKQKHQLLGF